MTRPSAVAVRAALEAPNSPDALLPFLTVTHPALVEPIRVVSDVMDYEVDGLLYRGLPFGITLLDDGEGISRTKLIIQNVDRRIGQALIGMTGRAVIAVDVRSSADFDLTQKPRVPIGTTAAIYGWRHFTLAGVTATATEITGDVVFQDYNVEPWPSVRATEDRLPGLFR